MNNLDLFINITEMIRGLVEVRKIYGSFVDIAHDKTYSQEERYEASELTKDGFHSFIGKIRKMNGGARLLTPRSQRNNDLLDSFNKGYISLPDIAQQLEKETGIRLDEGADQ